MLDLYMVIVPVFAALTLLNLLVLKLSIKDSVTLGRIEQHNQEAYHRKTDNHHESPVKSTLKYLLLHFTAIEVCAVRRAKYKLCLMLSLSVIAIGTYFIPSPYFFVATGTVVYFTYFFVAMAMSHPDQKESEETGIKKHREKYLQVLITILNIGLNFAIVGLIYKSYQNSVLSTFLANVALNIAFDNLLIRPTMTLVLSLPISLNSSVYLYVLECKKEVDLLEMYDLMGEKEMLARLKKQVSLLKLVRNIEIEPTPISNELLRNKQENPLEKPLNLLQKIKKQKMLDPINLNLHKNIELEGSLNSLFNSSKKSQQSEQIEEHRESEKASFEQKVSKAESSDFPLKNKNVSENLILINPSQQEQEQIQNEQDIIHQTIEEKIMAEEDNENDASYEFSQKRGATFNVGQNAHQPLRISLNNSGTPSSRQQPLRICLNGSINLDLTDKSDEDDEMGNDRRRRELMTIDDPTNKNPTFGVLQIKQKSCFNHGDEIQEIDLNSPERRRQGLHIEYEVQSKVDVIKKKKKKLSHDHQRVIKFSTGEPYLEYLPNMLSKDAKNKKSQGFSRKEIILDSRAVNSVKRPKKRGCNDNNENIVPAFRIQEL